MEISENARKLLEKDFKRLDKCGPDVPARVLNYVLSGEDDGVLEELANCKLACDLMGMEWGESKERVKFFNLRIDNATLHLRLAKAYDAIVRSKGIFNFFPFGNFHLDAFLYQMSETSPHYSSSYYRKLSLHTNTLLKMFEMVGLNRDELARRAFLSGSVSRRRFTGILVCLPGFNEYMAEYPEVLKTAFSSSEPNIVSDALEYCKIGSIKPDPYFDELLKIAITSNKKNRETAISLLELSREAALLALAEKFPSLSLKERQQAPKLIAYLLKDSSEVFRKLAANEKNEKVTTLLREYISEPSEPVRELPRPQVDANAPLSRETFELFNEIFHLSYTMAMDDYNKRTHHSEWKPESISQNKINKGFELLQSGTAKSCRNLYLMPSCWYDPVRKLTEQLILHPEFRLIHLLRLLAMFGDLSLSYPMLFYYQGRGAELIQTFHEAKPFNLFELAANTIAMGMEESKISMQFIHQECGIELHEPIGFNDNDIVDYFSFRTEELEQALISHSNNERLTTSDLSQRRRNALIILSKFERIPSKFLPHIWDIALGSLKTDKPYAQTCIAKVPGFTNYLIASIEDKNQDRRLSAVEWLGRIGEKAAIEPISRQYSKEKSDSAKGVFLTALERLGAKIEHFVNRDALLKEAQDGLQKGIPEQLSWISFTQFPKLYWKDTSEEVMPEIVQWLTVQSYKIGSPEPGPLLRRYAQMFSESKRHLGFKLLEQWIAQDTCRFSYEEAAAKVDRMTASWSSSDKEKYVDGLLREEMMKFKGSAINERGLLALVAALADGSVTPLVRCYIYEHRGNRSSQAKSLIQMLSWIDDPQAIQLLLAISSRFSVKGIRDEAEQQLAQMAERRGWTSDELADRTIPTAGFNDSAKAEFNYGSRTFYAKLTHNLQVQLTDSEGNILKALPEARTEDDPEKVKECKKLFSEMKKQIKTVLDTQSIRLYEAMCVQRAWRWSDWDTFLHRHPLVNHLCSRLVWTADGIAFRPLGDGTLTNAYDEPVSFSSESLVRIAHSCTTEGVEWLKHFSDYSITPLFDQFSAEKSYIPQGNSIKDFYGFVADGQALLNLAEKMGYIKAEADFERFFKDFRKRYSVGLEAVVETSGMHATVKGVKMERQRVALLQGYFRRVRGKPVDLSEVPPVLLAEFYKDMKKFAALAQYDPEWQKHVR